MSIAFGSQLDRENMRLGRSRASEVDVFMAVWAIGGLRSHVFMGFEKKLGGAVMTALMGLAR